MKKENFNKNGQFVDLEKNRHIATVSGATIILIEKEIYRLEKEIKDATRELSFLF